jgi:hypothetical protein
MEDGARFCGACGRRIDSEPSRSSEKSRSPESAGVAAPAPAAAPAKSAQASGPVSKRAVEPLAATMLSGSPLPGSPFGAPFAPPPAAAAPPAISNAATIAKGSPPTGLPAAGGAAPAAAAGGGTVRPVARPAESFIGRTLNNRYIVEDKIGEGGFGAVFRGKQIATGREVALKILHPHNSNDPTIVARFRREAEA